MKRSSPVEESDVASAIGAVFRDAGIEHELEGAYLTELELSAGRYEKPYPSSDVIFGLKLRERDSDAQQLIQSEQRRHEAGRYGRQIRARMATQERRAGVEFSIRSVPPGKDSKGHRNPAQIHFPLGQLIRDVIASASSARGRRSTRFENAAAHVLSLHRQTAGLAKPRSRTSLPVSMSLETRARLVFSHLSEMKNSDPRLTADFLSFITSELGLPPSSPLSPDEPQKKKEPPSPSLLSFLVGTSAGTRPGTDHVPGISEKAQQNSQKLEPKSAIQSVADRSVFNRNEAALKSLDEATLTADVFQSVRAEKFSFLLKDDNTGKTEREMAERSRRLKTFSRQDFEEKFLEMSEQSEVEQLSLIIGARHRNQIHLDDCSVTDAARLAPYSFAVVETSPNRFHVFLALRDWGRLVAIRQRLNVRLRELSPDSEANTGAGSVRWPGTKNFKPERQRPNGEHFTVRLVHASPALFTTEEELRDAGLLNDVAMVAAIAGSQRKVERRPDYLKILAKAPFARNEQRKAEGLPDRSWADFMWCRMYASWGASKKQIIEGLTEVSECARERGAQYVAHQATQGQINSRPWTGSPPKAA